MTRQKEIEKSQWSNNSDKISELNSPLFAFTTAAPRPETHKLSWYKLSPILFATILFVFDCLQQIMVTRESVAKLQMICKEVSSIERSLFATGFLIISDCHLLSLKRIIALGGDHLVSWSLHCRASNTVLFSCHYLT